MAGKTCPSCKEQTLYEDPTGQHCTKCQFRMTLQVQNGTGGPGRKCTNPKCNRMTVHNGRCTSCGATYSGWK